MKHIQDLLYEYMQGELDPARSKEVQDHLASCNECYAEFQILREGARLVRPLEGRPSERLSDAYWHNFAVRVQRRVEQEPASKAVTNPIWSIIESWMTYRPQRVLAAAGGIAAVVLMLTVKPFRPLQEDQSAMIAGGEPPETMMRANMELSDYFRTSKILLVGLTNMTPPEGQAMDFSLERQTARKLIQQARSLEHYDLDIRSQQLILALEKILIELANMEDYVNLPDVELIRTGIKQENMLFKIRMAEAEQSRPLMTTTDRSDIKQQ